MDLQELCMQVGLVEMGTRAVHEQRQRRLLFLCLYGLSSIVNGFVHLGPRRVCAPRQQPPCGMLEALSERDEAGWDLIERLVGAAAGLRETQRDVVPEEEFVQTDRRLLRSLDAMKERKEIRFWNSTRLEPYKVSKAELRVYARLQEPLETALGFTGASGVDRIELGLALVTAGTMFSSVAALDKLPGPDIVRWFVTAGILSLPFVYISLGLSFPEALIVAVNQLLFTLNREYKERILRHEAGHFLAGYLCGLPVLRYSVSGRLNAVQFTQLMTAAERQRAAASSAVAGPLSRQQAEEAAARARVRRRGRGGAGLVQVDELSKLTVVSLAGVVSEYIRFGRAEGGINDMNQLQGLIQLAGPMTEKEEEEQINWGVLTTYSLLKRHELALEALMDAFERGASTVECFAIIERYGGKERDS